jgi:hypothetical protein
MKRVLVLILCLVVTTFPQSRDDPERVNQKKPTVYLEYICQDEKNIYLRMHNNTIWQIIIGAEKSYFPTSRPITLRNGNRGYAVPSNEEVPLHYYIEKDELENLKKTKIPQKEPYYLNQGGRIVSGDSIRFSVPVDHLRKGLKIYVGFGYEWELSKPGDINREAEHRVYFRGGDIGSANTDIKPTACQK